MGPCLHQPSRWVQTPPVAHMAFAVWAVPTAEQSKKSRNQSAGPPAPRYYPLT